MKLGITGCPGSGKSVVSSALAVCGWQLIDADLLGRKVVEQRKDIIGALTEEFGNDILLPDGSLDRRLTAKRAFVSSDATARLNSIVHPILIEQLLQNIQSVDTHVVVDCALIYEWDIASYFDFIVCVHADPEVRITRIMKRDGRSREDVLRMFDAQLAEEEKIRRADLAIANDGGFEQIEALSQLLCHLPDILPTAGNND